MKPLAIESPYCRLTSLQGTPVNIRTNFISPETTDPAGTTFFATEWPDSIRSCL